MVSPACWQLKNGALSTIARTHHPGGGSASTIGKTGHKTKAGGSAASLRRANAFSFASHHILMGLFIFFSEQGCTVVSCPGDLSHLSSSPEQRKYVSSC